MTILIGISVVFTVAVAALLLLIRKMAVSGGSLPVTAEWIDELSMERYRPMMRLLDSEDLAFLKAQPGFTPRMATKLRIQRAQIFRGYLRSLCSDFSRVCAAVKILMLQSRHDRPDLATVLIRHRAMFAVSLATVHFRLLLYRWGIGSVDVTALMKSFDSMRLELRSLVPSAVPMGA